MSKRRDVFVTACPATVGAWNDLSPVLSAWLEGEIASPKARRAFLLAVEEMFVNIAFYAYSAEPNSGVEVTGRRQDGRVVVTLVDEGAPFDPLSRPMPNPGSLGDHVVPGGWGIYIARQSSDGMCYTRQGERNTLEIYKNVED